MNMVSAATDTAAVLAAAGGNLAAGSSTAAGTPGASDAQDKFLKLLVAQLKNQDPLSPMDNAQITSQMAQISTVSGIDKLNTTLQSMATSFTANQSLQASSMIGRSVFAPGSSLELQGGQALGGAELPQAADKVVVSIRDAAGQVLHRVDLGPQAAGVVTFQWDGVVDSGASAVPGTYSFAVEAVQGGNKMDAVALAHGLVNSVKQGAGGVMLNVSGVGAVALSDAKQIM